VRLNLPSGNGAKVPNARGSVVGTGHNDADAAAVHTADHGGGNPTLGHDRNLPAILQRRTSTGREDRSAVLTPGADGSSRCGKPHCGHNRRVKAPPGSANHDLRLQRPGPWMGMGLRHGGALDNGPRV